MDFKKHLAPEYNYLAIPLFPKMFLNIYLCERQNDRDWNENWRGFPSASLVPQVPAIARSGLWWSQELQTPFGPPRYEASPQVLKLSSIAFPHICFREADQKQESQDSNQHSDTRYGCPKEKFNQLHDNAHLLTTSILKYSHLWCHWEDWSWLDLGSVNYNRAVWILQ